MTLRQVLASGATAVTAAALVLTAAGPAQAATCHFKVVWNVTGVYKYAQEGNILKNKNLGDTVGESCTRQFNDVEGRYYRKVNTNTPGAINGEAWMKDDALVRVG